MLRNEGAEPMAEPRELLHGGDHVRLGIVFGVPVGLAIAEPHEDGRRADLLRGHAGIAAEVGVALHAGGELLHRSVAASFAPKPANAAAKP